MLSQRIKNIINLRLFRAFSGDHNSHHRVIKHGDTEFVEGSLESYKENLPKSLKFNERLIFFANKWFPTVDITYFFRNDRDSKLALYYWLGKLNLYFLI